MQKNRVKNRVKRAFGFPFRCRKPDVTSRTRGLFGFLLSLFAMRSVGITQSSEDFLRGGLSARRNGF